uniref:Uncharacterized protein n=1 Tax=viral metagenome TaxID=1070528 RepID=A0A6M3L6G6_9ZZZZ
MTLAEQYAQALDDLLNVLMMVKASGDMVDGMPSSGFFNFAKSEITGLAQGFQTKEECKGCSDCCVKPMAVVPLQGIDGGLIRPLRYGLKYRFQPCWWLRQKDGAFLCALHDTKQKPFTCYSYQCSSRANLEAFISNAEKGTPSSK